MKRYLKQLSLLVVIASFMAIALSVTITPGAHAATSTAQASYLGGVNLNAYCQSFGYVGVTTVGTTVYDWRCVNANGGLSRVDMLGACMWQYGLGVLDYSTNFYVATSIYCAKSPTLLGGINLRWYCQLTGYADVTTVGTTAYDWRCVKSDGTLAIVNMAWACVYQYGTAITLPRFANFYTMTSWQCWK